MPAIYTRGGHALNENILLKIFAFDDSASDARTPCIAKGWEAVRTGSSLYRETDGELVRREADLHGLGGVWRECEFSKDGSLLAVIGHNYKIALYDTATGDRRLAPSPRRET